MSQQPQPTPDEIINVLNARLMAMQARFNDLNGQVVNLEAHIAVGNQQMTNINALLTKVKAQIGDKEFDKAVKAVERDIQASIDKANGKAPANEPVAEPKPPAAVVATPAAKTLKTLTAAKKGR